ncbi:MAG: folate-binding protein [Nocardioidaceae bacterium]
MVTNPSPLLALPGAVAGDGADAAVAAHYGSFNKEQAALTAGEAFVDLSHREVFSVSGPDRLTYLHSLTTAYFEGLEPGREIEALILDPQGHVEHAFRGVDDGERFLAHTEPGTGTPLAEFLDRMRFMLRVEIAEHPELAVVYRRGEHSVIPRAELAAYAQAAGEPAGMWAYEALRIARGEPRLGVDTDHRAIPNELGWVGTAVHLDKGCYRGQETVARVHTLGRPPRRLTLLHLDGSANRLPAVGADLLDVAGKVIGRVGGSARHYELGPIALALVKRTVPVDAVLDADGLPASQEVVVDPEVGLHVRPRLA